MVCAIICVLRKATEITKNILNEFKRMLQQNTWMDATSKAKAIEKANTIRPQIGYPDNYDNRTYVENTFNVKTKTLILHS